MPLPNFTAITDEARIVLDNVLYVATTNNILYALDLTQPGAPMKWTFKPKPAAASQGVACCDTVNRGAAYADGIGFWAAGAGGSGAVGGGVWFAPLGSVFSK